MTFTVQGTVTMDGKAAKAEIKAVGDEAKKAASGAEKFSKAGKGAGSGVETLGKKADFAAGSIGNLTAQGNDLLIMTMAMQNPLQMAIQQGTQITQVFGNAGAAKAGMMLKQALVSMVSPLNLITIGGIAAAGMLVQWSIGAISAADDTKEFEERLEQLDDAIAAYSASAEMATLTTDQLRERFGHASEGLIQTIDLLEQISRNEAQRAIDGIAQSLGDMMGIAGDGDRRTGIADFFDVNIGLAFTEQQRNMRSEARQLTGEFLSQQNALKGAAGDLDQQIAIMREMLATTRELASAKDGISAAEEGVIKKIAETLVKMEQQRGKVVEVERSVEGVTQAAYEAAQGFAAGIAPVDTLIGKVGALAKNAWSYAAAMSREKTAYEGTVGRGRGADPRMFGGSARDIQQNDMRAQLAYAPGGSVGVPVQTYGSAGGGGRSAARAAQREQKAIDDLIASQREQIDLMRETDPVLKEMIENRRVLATATEAERETVQELIATRIAEEAAIERATDNAETFRSTTYEALDGLILRGEKGRDVLANLADAFAEAAFQSAFLGKGFLADVFGTSGSGGLLGIVAGALFPGAQKNADGGMVYGAGGPRDDLVPVLASPGEFWVNAQATAANRGVLEYINAGGRVSGFAGGGMVAAPTLAAMPATVGGGGGQGRVVIQIMPSDLFDARVIEQSQGVMVEGLEQYRQQSLASDIEAYTNDPARRG